MAGVQVGDARALAEAVQHQAHLKRHLSSLDMAHKWKIDAVQHKYQEHMESVRSRAQTSIDTINQQYKLEKAQMEASLASTVAQMQAANAAAQVGPLGQVGDIRGPAPLAYPAPLHHAAAASPSGDASAQPSQWPLGDASKLVRGEG